MNMHLEEWVIRERLEEARAYAARRAVLSTLRVKRLPVRVSAGLALIRAGRWLAGQAPKPQGEPKRATA